jgi:hypothetical protein
MYGTWKQSPMNSKSSAFNIDKWLTSRFRAVSSETETQEPIG